MKMKRKILYVMILAASSTASYAGRDYKGEMSYDNDQLLIEAGINYFHTFYRSSITPPESRTADFPNGFAISPNSFYPNNFWGGYIGLSYYTHHWLLNSRYNMYSSKSKTNSSADVRIELAPVSLVFTADKVWGDINCTSFGVGAGAVIANLNDGEFIQGPTAEPGTEGSHSLAGEGTRIDPVIEAFVMQRFYDHFNVKLNAAYQIPYYSANSRGDLAVALGINYAINV